MSDVIWIHYARPRTPWYELEDSERQAHQARFAEVRAESERNGGDHQGLFHVRGNGDYSSVEVWRFPDADAAFAHWARMTDAEYARWFAFSNNVGLNAHATDGQAQA